jgi:hypothetical protein
MAEPHGISETCNTGFDIAILYRVYESFEDSQTMVDYRKTF